MTTLAVLYVGLALGFAAGIVCCSVLVMASRSQRERRHGPVA